MSKSEFVLPVCGENLHCICWEPEGRVNAVLQIVHGMIEYADRYDETARFLCSRGFAVVSHDHPGHGLTASCDEELGYIREDGGSALLTDCVFGVTEWIRKKYPELPNYIFGHSMGSFVTRRFLTLHADSVSGAAIIGTGNQSLPTLKLGKAVAKADIRLHGAHHRSKLLTLMAFGAYNKRCRGGSPAAWISSDKEIQKKHDSDKFCTFFFTSAGFLALFDTLEYLARGTGLENIPKNLPLYIAAGEEDPVGIYGREPAAFCTRMCNLGMTDVTFKLYKGDRHEIFNEVDREAVCEDFAAWLTARTEALKKQ